MREGLCSHHLSRVTPGELVRVTVRPSRFRPPKNLAASPVIMVRAAGPKDGGFELEICLSHLVPHAISVFPKKTTILVVYVVCMCVV